VRVTLTQEATISLRKSKWMGVKRKCVEQKNTAIPSRTAVYAGKK